MATRLSAILVCALLVACPSVASAYQTDAPGHARVRLAARPLDETVPVGQPVRIELQYTNVSDAPLSINLGHVGDARVECISTLGPAVAFGTRWPGQNTYNDHAPQFQRIEPGASFKLEIINYGVSFVAMGAARLSLSVTFNGTNLEPPDGWLGSVAAEPITVTVVDNPVLSGPRAGAVSSDFIRAEFLPLLDNLAKVFPGARALALIGATQAGPIAGALTAIASDVSLPVPTRAQALAYLPLALSALGDAARKPVVAALTPLAADGADEVRAPAVACLAVVADDPGVASTLLAAVEDPSPTVRLAILAAPAFRTPSADVAPLLAQCVASAGDADALALLRGLRRVISSQQIPVVAASFLRRPENVQLALLGLAELVPPAAAAPLLEAALASPFPAVEAAAVDAIGLIKDPALAGLLDTAAANPSLAERVDSVRAEFPPEIPYPDVKRLMAQYFDPPWTAPAVSELVRLAKLAPGDRKITDRLLSLTVPGYEADFRSLLDSGNEATLTLACLYLSRVKDSASYAKIAEMTRSPWPAARAIAAEALGDFADPAGVPYLVDCLKDKNGPSRELLIRALAKIPGARARDAVIDVLRSPANYGSSYAGYILDALVQRRDRTVLPALIDMIENPPPNVFPQWQLKDVVRQISGHWEPGDYTSGEGRSAAARQWRSWWQKDGRLLPSQPPVEPGAPVRGASLLLYGFTCPSQPGETAKLQYRLTNASGFAFLAIPLGDDGPNYLCQYVLSRNGVPVARAFFNMRRFLDRYTMIPFLPVGFFSSLGGDFDLPAGLPPGAYTVQIVIRMLCTQTVQPDRATNTALAGEAQTVAGVFTFKSNQLEITLPAYKDPAALSDDTIARLAALAAQRNAAPIELEDATFGVIGVYLPWQAAELLAKAGPRGIKALLGGVNPTMLDTFLFARLCKSDDPGAAAVCEEAFLSGNPSARDFLTALKSDHPAVIARLLSVGTGDLRSRGWFDPPHALVSLEGRLGPAQKEYALFLVDELDARLRGERDRGSLRGGESIYGAFRPAFFLGQLGDTRANAALRRAIAVEGRLSEEGKRWDPRRFSVSGLILLRWYADAALKLIDLQNRPEPERTQLIERWLLRCFASPEEHFMARARLIPFLNSLLAGRAKPFYRQLRPQVRDAFMLADIDEILEGP